MGTWACFASQITVDCKSVHCKRDYSVHHIVMTTILQDSSTSLVPDGGPVCDMLSPKFECFSE